MKIISTFLLFLFATAFATRAQFDMQPTHAGPVQYLEPGTYPLTLYAKNNDINYPVTYFQSHWQLDNGAVHSCDIDADLLVLYDMLYPGYYAAPFNHCDEMVLNNTGTYTLKTWTANPEGNPDTNPANDTLYTTITVVDELPEKNVLFFIGTHQNCFPCGGMGEMNMYLVLDAYPDNVFLASAHDDYPSDPFSCDDCQDFNDAYIWPFSGHPTFLFDLYTFPFYWDVVSTFYEDQTQAVAWRLPYQSPLEVEIENVELDMENLIISGDVRTTFYAPHAGSLAMNVILTEDSIYGPQAGYALNDSLYHRFVMHDMGAGVWGDATVIPTTVNAGDEFVYSFTMPVPEGANANQLYLIGYVQKNSGNVLTNEVFNSAQVRVSETASVDVQNAVASAALLRAFPNPASDVLNISYNGSATSLHLINAWGQPVKNISVPASGSNVQLDCSALPAGIYMLNDENGNGVKVSVVR